MSSIYFILLLVICWQPIYLAIMMAFHTAKGDTYDRAAYAKAFSAWWTQLVSLVFSKPGV